MIEIRESLVSTADLPISSSSRNRHWDGVEVDEFDINANSEITLPAADRHVIAMVISGVTDCVQRRDAKSHHSMVRPGSVMIVPAGVTSYFNASKAHKTSTTQVAPELLSAAAEEFGLPSGVGAELQAVFEAHDSLITHLISILIGELRYAAHPAQKLIVGSAVNALAAHLVRAYDGRAQRVPKAPATLTPRQLAAVVNYCEDSIGSPISLGDLAAVANVSRFHFTRLFRLSTGMSPMEYLERLRIGRAQALIRQGQLQLSAIALAAGFADQSHFTKRFHLYTGVTPGQYRREVGRSSQ